MNNRFELSPDFTIEHERTARTIETVTATVFNPIPERAVFIAAILADARPTARRRAAGVFDAIRLTLDGTANCLPRGLVMNDIF